MISAKENQQVTDWFVRYHKINVQLACSVNLGAEVPTGSVVRI